MHHIKEDRKMAKRELIDRNDLESTTIITDDFSGNEMLDVVLMEDVKEAPVITEQEIVKPYLEKLKSEIEKIPTTTPIMYGNCTRGYEIEHPREIKRKAMNMIDNLLSESEGK